MLVVLSVPLRPWRSERQRYRELRTAAREELVVARHTVQRDAQVEVVRCSVGNHQVVPVLHHVSRVAQLQRESEVVVGPAQALSPSHAQSEHTDILVGVVVALVVVVVAAAVAIVVAPVVVHHTTVVVVVRERGVLAVVCSHGELYGSFATEPRRRIRHVVRLIVATVGLHAERQSLAVTDRQYASVLLVLAEEVAHRPVGELQSHATDDTGLSPA